MKCGYKYCKFDGEVSKKEGVKYKNRWHHKECAEERKNKEKIRKIYLEKIDKYANKAQLNKAIKQIIHDKKQNSSFVLFALNYAIENNIKLNNPFGLHWIIKDKNIIKTYKEKILKKQEYEIINKILNQDEKGYETSFKYKPSKKNRNWNKILPE